jgi:hypothetical protein
MAEQQKPFESTEGNLADDNLGFSDGQAFSIQEFFDRFCKQYPYDDFTDWQKIREFLNNKTSSDSIKASFLYLYVQELRDMIASTKDFKEEQRITKIHNRALETARHYRNTKIESAPKAETKKLKVTCSQTQFVLLIGQLFQLQKFSSDDGNVPWAEVCKHFIRSNGKEFKPGDLASEWSEINPAKPGGARNVRGGTEIEKIIESASEFSRPAERRAEPFIGSYTESGVAKSAPGRVGSERR